MKHTKREIYKHEQSRKGYWINQVTGVIQVVDALVIQGGLIITIAFLEQRQSQQ